MLFVKLNIQRFAEDGKIIIGTEVDTKKLEKQLEQLEKEQDRLKDKKLKLDLDNTKALNDLQKVDDKLEILNQKIAEFELNNIPEVRAESVEYQEMINQRNQLNAKGEEYLQKLDLIKSKQSEINESMQENANSIESINNRLNNMPLNLNGINNGLKKVIKSVTRWGLALFGIRSAYSFIRQMISQATQQNEELANKMQYVKSALGSAFQPLAKIIVDVVYKLVAGIGALIKLITGKNIFKNVNKDLKNANKNAKALNKTLAGWDEATVLGSNSNLANGLLGNGLNIADDVETIGQKIKRWFMGGDTWEEGWNNALKFPGEVWNEFVRVFTPLAKWINDNALQPIWNEIKNGIDILRPLWEPVYIEFKNTIDNKLKPFWNDFINYLKPIKEEIDKKFEPIKKSWEEMVEGMKLPWIMLFNSLPEQEQIALRRMWDRFKEFYNKIAFYLNNIGVNIPYITDEWITEINNVENETTKSLDEIGNEANNTKQNLDKMFSTQKADEFKRTGLIGVLDKLKELTSKTWKIVTTFVTDTNSRNKTVNSWLDPLRNQLSKIGINLPRLAVGGIVNMPAKGVNYAGANMGENGPEGVIPLTNAQQMDLLGQSIAKHMTINATIPVYAYNREVDRQIQKIRSQESMARNQ